MHHKKSLIIFFYLIISISVFNYWNCAEKEKPDKLDKKRNSIHVINTDSLKNIISQNQGNVIFINIWATWCEPCVREFPDIVRIFNEYKNKDVKFLSLSVDSESDIDSLVIPFLKRQNAEFPVYIVDEKSSESIINFLNPDWSGAIPVTIIFGKNGEQRKFLSGLQHYPELKNYIDSVRTIL